MVNNYEYLVAVHYLRNLSIVVRHWDYLFFQAAAFSVEIKSNNGRTIRGIYGN
jgi:hypothetical protein